MVKITVKPATKARIPRSNRPRSRWSSAAVGPVSVAGGRRSSAGSTWITGPAGPPTVTPTATPTAAPTGAGEGAGRGAGRTTPSSAAERPDTIER